MRKNEDSFDAVRHHSEAFFNPPPSLHRSFEGVHTANQQQLLHQVSNYLSILLCRYYQLTLICQLIRRRVDVADR